MGYFLSLLVTHCRECEQFYFYGEYVHRGKAYILELPCDLFRHKYSYECVELT